jgi:hypothetical protein
MDSDARRGLGVALVAAVIAFLTYDSRDASPYVDLTYLLAVIVAVAAVAFVGVRLIWPRRH